MNKHFRTERRGDAFVAYFLDKSIHADEAIAGLGDELSAGGQNQPGGRNEKQPF